MPVTALASGSPVSWSFGFIEIVKGLGANNVLTESLDRNVLCETLSFANHVLGIAGGGLLGGCWAAAGLGGAGGWAGLGLGWAGLGWAGLGWAGQS